MDNDDGLRPAYEAILQGDFEAALRLFEQAIAREPDNATYYYKASITSSRNGKIAQAAAYARKAAELKPEDPDYRLHLQAMLARERLLDTKKALEQPSPAWDQCAEWLNEALRYDPLSVEGWLLLGVVYRGLRNYRSALAALREALQLEPQQEAARRLMKDIKAEWRKLLKQQYTQHHWKRNR